MSIKFLIGDVFEQLATLPDESVDCIVTSPPYWGLRSYLDEKDPDKKYEIGLEPTFGEHVDVIVRVMREGRRVLKKDGTCWFNYGDAYATQAAGRSAADTKAAGNDDRTYRDKPFSTVGPVYGKGKTHPFPQGRRGGGNNPAGAVLGKGKGGGFRGDNKGNCKGGYKDRIEAGGILKPKDLIMMPARIAIALQDDGWWVRSEIVWNKPNPMPESAGSHDRPSCAHEKIFLLTKNGGKTLLWRCIMTGRWTWQKPNTSEPYLDASGEKVVFKNGKYKKRWAGHDYYYNADAVRTPLRPKTLTTYGIKRKDLGNDAGGNVKASKFAKSMPVRKPRQDKQSGHGRRHAGFNERYKKSRGSTPRHEGHIEHTKLDETPRGEGANLKNVWTMATVAFPEAHFATFPPELAETCIKAGCPKGGTVLDLFAGAGTTGMAADRLQRDAILIELNPEYAAMAQRRIKDDGGMFAETDSAICETCEGRGYLYGADLVSPVSPKRIPCPDCGDAAKEHTGKEAAE